MGPSTTLQRLTLSLVLLFFALAFPAKAAEPTDGDPVEVYRELDGTWSGEFVGWDTAGKELYRIQVQQIYRTLDGETQTVDIVDTAADGTTTTGRGRNTARRLDDGSLELKCLVEKSNGDRVEHAGRLVKGPSGKIELVWYSQAKDREETFRERVLHQDGREVYAIDGLGRYGQTVVLMAGRYYRQDQGAAAKQ